jgi:hypothetical protein
MPPLPPSRMLESSVYFSIFILSDVISCIVAAISYSDNPNIMHVVQWAWAIGGGILGAFWYTVTARAFYLIVAYQRINGVSASRDGGEGGGRGEERGDKVVTILPELPAPRDLAALWQRLGDLGNLDRLLRV